MPHFSVIIDRDTLQFTASHWVRYRPTAVETMPDGEIVVRREERTVVEPLHRHAFRAKLEISGELDEFGCVIDFVLAERLMVHILQQYDQKIFVPANAPDLGFRQDGSQLTVWVNSNKLVFLEKDVKCLPVKNVSTETIAETILAEFVAAIQKNNILPAPFSDDQFVLTLEEDSGMYARIAYHGSKQPTQGSGFSH
jgi:6-pyruvoyl-tetrahydropterin synthase